MQLDIPPLSEPLPEQAQTEEAVTDLTIHDDSADNAEAESLGADKTTGSTPATDAPGLGEEA